MSQIGTKLATLKPRSFVVLNRAGEETTWHVNKAVETSQGDLQTKSLILQPKDASAEWLTFILTQDGSEWVVDKALEFEGDIEHDGNPVATEELEVVAVKSSE